MKKLLSAKSIGLGPAILVLLLANVWLGVGCGASQTVDHRMQERWQWDRGVEASRLMNAIDQGKGQRRLTALVGVTGFGVRGRVLPDGAIWDFEAKVDVLPSISGDTVLFTGEGQLYALDLVSGKLLFKASVSGRRLEGAGYDGEHFILLLVDQDDARQDEIRTVTKQGAELGSVQVDARLGTPAAVAGVGLVPYGGQYVAGFDIKSGEWIGRLLYRDALHAITADDQGILLWGRGVTRFNAELTSDPESRALLLPLEAFPGDPEWPVDGSKPRPPRARPINVFAYPVANEGQLIFANNTYVTTYYQLILGQEVGSSELKWVTALPKSVAGGAISQTNVTLCLEDGSLARLSLKSGQLTTLGTLDTRLKACVVSTDDQAVDPGKRPDLRQQILEAISSTGPDMAKVQSMLLDKLSTMKGPETTVALLTLAQDPTSSSELAKYAGNLLSSQKKGGEAMVFALNEYSNQRAARLKQAGQELTVELGSPPSGDPTLPSGTPTGPESSPDATNPTPAGEVSATRRSLRPPPVAAIAQALKKQKTPGAAAALVHYLNDPALHGAQVLTVMKTVSALGGPKETPEVLEFVRSYKNTGGETRLMDALVLAVEFLFLHLSEEDRTSLKAEINQTLTHPELRRRVRSIKSLRETPKPASTPSKAPTPRASGAASGTP